jgi:hypothetical protein
MVIDENVFSIQQGVGISLFVLDRCPMESSVRVYELTGQRERKYSWLATHSVSTTTWQIVNPQPDLYRFGVVSGDIDNEYQTFVSVKALFAIGNVGYQTHRDEFIIDWDRDALVRRLRNFRDHRANELELTKRFDVHSNHDWAVLEAHRALQKQKSIEELVKETLYRPFDIRHICYASYLIDRDRRELMRHMQGGNVGLLVSKVFDEHEFTSVFITKRIVESKVADRTRGAYLFPLRLADQTEELIGEWRSNITPECLAKIAELLGVKIEIGVSANGAKSISDFDILGYLYAVLHSVGYRRRYAQFLKVDFPRVPLPPSLSLFRALAQFGGELIALHLLESPKLEELSTDFVGLDTPEVENVFWSQETVWLNRSQTAGFKPVPDVVWNFHIGGYQVCEKWLKDRRGHTLSKEEISNYQRIMVAVSETIQLMKQIDKAIEQYGGWPEAFTGPNRVTREGK